MAFDIVIGADAQPATFSIVIGTTPSSVIPGAGPAGVFTFAVDAEASATVTFEWQTDLLKAVDGSEQRAALLARPRQRYEMRALLTDVQHRQILARLAVSGASGALFNLRLPYEELSVKSCSGTTVTVETLSLCDWADPGQRATVVHPVTGVAIDAVVQSAAGASILLDVDVSSVAIAGARIMPIVGVYLDPTQALDRYRVKLGTWDIRARADRFRFGLTGPMGTGATVATFDGLPVWDAGVVNQGGTRAESLVTGVDIVDLGASIGAIGNFTRPDWPRGVLIESSDPADWQWFKAFLNAVKGRYGAFLLPTGRPDLTPLSVVGNDLTVTETYTTEWYPSLAHRRLRAVYANGSASYHTVTGSTTVGPSDVLNTSAAFTGLPVSVEFLETVRLDQDAISVDWDGGTFSSEFAVRTVQHVAEADPVGYAAHENSLHHGEPVEIYTLVLSGRTYRLTTAEEDVVVAAQTYTATPGLGRGVLTLRQIGKVRELEVTLARSHPAAAVLMSGGIPPRIATLVLKRAHRGDTEARQQWAGSIQQVRVDGPYLRLRVPNASDEALNTTLPFAKVSHTCQHLLYGAGCGIDRNYPTFANYPFMSATTVVAQVGTTLTVGALVDPSAVARPSQWAQYGEVRRVVDGERRSVLSQIASTLVLDRPFAFLAGGDDLEVYAGCDHVILTCRDKFANAVHFGGHPGAPDNNPMNVQDDA